jgi:hypothetical protein
VLLMLRVKLLMSATRRQQRLYSDANYPMSPTDCRVFSALCCAFVQRV